MIQFDGTDDSVLPPDRPEDGFSVMLAVEGDHDGDGMIDGDNLAGGGD